MKASEVVTELNKLIEQHGDLDVYSCDPADDYSWLVHTVMETKLTLDDDKDHFDETEEEEEARFEPQLCIIIRPT